MIYTTNAIEAPVALDARHMNAAKAAVREFLRAQHELLFPLRERERCRRCGFHRGLCPANVVFPPL